MNEYRIKQQRDKFLLQRRLLTQHNSVDGVSHRVEYWYDIDVYNDKQKATAALFYLQSTTTDNKIKGWLENPPSDSYLEWT